MPARSVPALRYAATPQAIAASNGPPICTAMARTIIPPESSANHSGDFQKKPTNAIKATRLIRRCCADMRANGPRIEPREYARNLPKRLSLLAKIE